MIMSKHIKINNDNGENMTKKIIGTTNNLIGTI